MIVTTPSGKHGPANPGPLMEELRARGVAVFEGSIFESRDARGVPPVGATKPRVVLQPKAAPLSEEEQAGVFRAVRGKVLAFVEAHLERDPMSVDLMEAHYRIEASKGGEVVVEMHGLVDRVVRLSLN